MVMHASPSAVPAPAPFLWLCALVAAGRHREARRVLGEVRSSPALDRQYVNRLWLAVGEALLDGSPDALDEAIAGFEDSATMDVALAHELGAVVLEAPYTSAVDVAALRFPIVPVGWLMKDRFESLARIGAIKFAVRDGGKRAVTHIHPLHATRQGSLIEIELGGELTAKHLLDDPSWSAFLGDLRRDQDDPGKIACERYDRQRHEKVTDEHCHNHAVGQLGTVHKELRPQGHAVKLEDD